MPKHIILSRKGFDNSAGGRPSPIIDKDLLSFPIPNPNNFKPKVPISYTKLKYKEKSYAEILSELTDNQFDRKTCHLDPDIYKDIYPRAQGWKALFGPEKGKYTHLMEHGVGIGDLILFFGWFWHVEEKAGKYTYCQSPDFPTGVHVIFGYMEIGDICAADDVPAWAQYHPHVSEEGRENEHVFIAAKSEIFPFSDKLVLTKKGFSRSRWNLPFLKDIDMSCNPNREKRWHGKEGYFQTVGRGQEFVMKAEPEVMKWVNSILS